MVMATFKPKVLHLIDQGVAGAVPEAVVSNDPRLISQALAIHASLDEVEKLKDKVRKFLKEVQNDEPSKVLNLIDALQRLGVSYHFEIEIEEAMKHIHDHEIILSFLNDDRLHDVALCFRLIRQGGYNLSSGYYMRISYKDDILEAHIRAFRIELMILPFKAVMDVARSQEVCLPITLDVGTNNEKLLDGEFTLTSSIKRATSKEYAFFLHEFMGAVKHKYGKKVIIQFENFANHNAFELISMERVRYYNNRWWKKLDFALKLPFARDRIVECYFWIVGTYYEPSYALARLFLTKATVLTSVVDDIYDIYGTIDELKLFTDAFERRGHVASAVECFMKEYGASKQEACNEINKMVEEAWKDVNEGCLTRSTVIPRPLLMAILNLTRVVLVIYKYEEDTYTHSDTRMKENVAILFIDPIDP
ncbi:hypothetical protein Sjap_008231 [Stephania japonica]|uniref:Malic enzyme N-terminal domain-containing protein n=1 Tax=Stephania japonica TaxID=461633 RepID=A0AAP0JP81_9MAGN